MECYYHNGRIAQGQCLSCGRALCSRCMDVGGKMRLCSECAVGAHRTYQRQIYMTLGFSVLFAVIGFILFKGGPESPFLGAYTGFSVFWGRRFVRDIFHSATNGLWVTWSGLYWIKVFQLFFYMFVGFFTAPFAVALAIYRLRQSGKNAEKIRQEQMSVSG